MECDWPHLYACLDPVAFSAGPVDVYWYALCFWAGWLVALISAWSAQGRLGLSLTRERLFDLALWLLLGALAGGRLGYALLYHPAYFAAEPWRLVVPFDPGTGSWTGLSGMSYHGALLGAGLALFFFARQTSLSFWSLADLAALCVPLGIFFGRLGNFLNGELIGRETAQAWGVFFPGIPGLRHPVALYEALGEGILLFLLLRLSLRWRGSPGDVLIVFLGAYAPIRFGLEYFRLPDPELGLFWGGLTLGQYLSCLMLAGALLMWSLRQKYATIRSD